MITTASSVIVGLVLTVCDVKTEECEIYIPATYETKTTELGKELCRADFRKYINDFVHYVDEPKAHRLSLQEAMQDEKYYILDAKCVRLTD